MLYCRVDKAGRPLESAQPFRVIQEEFAATNTLIGLTAFLNSYVNVEEPTYKEVPLDGKPLPTTGSGEKVLPDVPNLEADGQLSRKWKVVSTDADEREEFAIIQRRRRDRRLRQHIDCIGVPWWNSLYAEDQKTITDYYDALRNMPNEPSWPHVSMPRMPDILFNHIY